MAAAALLSGLAALALHLDVTPILRGHVVSSRDFVPQSLVDALRKDALSLFGDGEFASSGLSNTAQQEQGFGKKDRLVRAITPDLEGDRDARRAFDRHLDGLRENLGASLNRSLICAEQYYSIHGPGACTHRHALTQITFHASFCLFSLQVQMPFLRGTWTSGMRNSRAPVDGSQEAKDSPVPAQGHKGSCWFYGNGRKQTQMDANGRK